MSDIDRSILEKFRVAPNEALRLLFETYHLELCTYSFLITNSSELAEDIVQDFLIQFWEKKYYRNIKTNLRSYLFYSVRNASIRAVGSDVTVSLNEFGDEKLPSVDLPTDGDEIELLKEKLVKALKELTPQELNAVRKVYLENKKYRVAAEEMEISLNTLKTYLSRALSRLRGEFTVREIIIISYILCHPLL